ncbi:hypothetical protein CsSME_00019448 [Camellia sinensis var. sinensis]
MEEITLGRSFISRKINRLFLKRASKNTSSIAVQSNFEAILKIQIDINQLFRAISKIQIDFGIQSNFEAPSPPSSAPSKSILVRALEWLDNFLLWPGSMLHQSSLWMKSTALDLLKWNLDLVMVIVTCRGRCRSFSINWMDLSI